MYILCVNDLGYGLSPNPLQRSPSNILVNTARGTYELSITILWPFGHLKVTENVYPKAYKKIAEKIRTSPGTEMYPTG